jgi:hypothetical protein
VVDYRELTYEKTRINSAAKEHYSIVTKRYENQQMSNWTIYNQADRSSEPSQIFTVYRRGNILFINHELYEFNKPGFCRDSEDNDGKVRLCIKEILPTMKLTQELSFDSVYVFEKTQYMPLPKDSTSQVIYISATDNLILKKVKINRRGEVIESEVLSSLQYKE